LDPFAPAAGEVAREIGVSLWGEPGEDPVGVLTVL
jgi:hypothetical protein